MADIALGSVERIFKAGLAIKKAVETVRQNKKKCRDIGRTVARVSALLWLLNGTTEKLKHPAITGPLEDLADILEEALELITDCEGRHPVRHLFGARGMARELGRVHDDILQKLTLGHFAATVHVTITLTHTVQYGVSLAHRPRLLPQDAGEVANSCIGNLTTDDARSGINSDITVVTTTNEVPYDSSSRSTEFNLSELEATMHHISEENINGGGGHSFVLKQKFVFKISVACLKSRSKALALIAKVDGVISMGLTGDGMDMLQVFGSGVDPVCLVQQLRKLGHAEILQVEGLRANEEAQPVVANTEEAPPADKPANRRQRGIGAIITKLPKFMRPHARRSISRPPPSPLCIAAAAVHDHQHGHTAGLLQLGAREEPISSTTPADKGVRRPRHDGGCIAAATPASAPARDGMGSPGEHVHNNPLQLPDYGCFAPATAEAMGAGKQPSGLPSRMLGAMNWGRAAFVVHGKQFSYLALVAVAIVLTFIYVHV